MHHTSRPVFAVVLLLLATACAGLAQAAPSAPLRQLTSVGPNTLHLWQDAAIFTPVRQLIDAAGSGDPVWVEMYEFGRSDLAAALRQARDRGADVRLIVDRTVRASAETADRLLAAGLAVRAYPVDDRRHQIDHVKLLLVRSHALVGGMNWGATSYRNHDYAYETAAPAVLDRLRAIFRQDWSLSGGQPAPIAPAAGSVAQTAPGQEIRNLLMQALASAARSVQAEVFVLTDSDVIEGLAAARRRGVSVRLLLDPDQDVNRASFGLLRESGVDVRWYPVPPGAKLHAKAALFDGRRLLVGSANWSLSGLSVNHELDLLFDDATTADAFASRFERDWSISA
ncbi:MAG TPA: phosphatidylserine/phosphatidylglycerophosphate/cardiolipin synthase family protein [Terriglobales bacterium]|nr:phosphatidylserine/phosphatidylglycerophosphate/cardiolipin synthase family protein [Terriglobales bacterium]